MDDELALQITFEAPGGDAAPGTLALLDVRCLALGTAKGRGRLADPLEGDGADPLPWAAVAEDLRWYLEDYWKWPYGGFAARARGVEAMLGRLGRLLYRQVFAAAGNVVGPWKLRAGRRLKVCLLGEMPAGLSLPWELLHDEQGFLALRSRPPVAIVRQLPEALDLLDEEFEPPLRVLLVTARPEGPGFVDPRAIARGLLDEIESRGLGAAEPIALEFLRPPTLAALRARLEDSDRPVHVLHFDGHGVCRDGRGHLAFEDEHGGLDLVEAGALAQVLQGSGVRLAVLTACQSAMGAPDDPSSSVAGQLLRGGVPVVAAMGSSVLVTAAARYAESFYRALARGEPASSAHERARQALHDDRRRHLHRRHGDRPGTPVELLDWWMPHFYEQRPVRLRPTTPSRTSVKAPTRPLVGLPPEPRHGFGGRALELLRIERWLRLGKAIVIHGFGGGGKTALAREAAVWLTRTGLYAGACRISLASGGDAATVLTAVGRLLGVKPDPAALRRKLATKPVLVIVDDLEAVLPGGEAPLDPSGRAALWDALLGLSAAGAGLLLVTRDFSFGDGRLAPGGQAAHLELAGLLPDEALELAGRLLDDLAVDKAAIAFPDLSGLLEDLGGLPLAIQLVLPSLREMPARSLREGFDVLLPRFVDPDEPGRNGSLAATLEASLRRLSAAERTALARLAPFEGGAFEEILLAVTALDGDVWPALRSALQRTALARRERIDGEASASYLRLHPALPAYLRSQPGGDDARVSAAHMARYRDLADALRALDIEEPTRARARALTELPNLLRALRSLIRTGSLDEAVAMLDRLGRFLQVSGRTSELDAFARQIEMGCDTAADDVLLLLGRADYEKGRFAAAVERFGRLLGRIEAEPLVGDAVGPRSLAHATALHGLGRGLERLGRTDEALDRMAVSLQIVEEWSERRPEDPELVGRRGDLMGDLGGLFAAKRDDASAATLYREALRIAEWRGDLRGRTLVLERYGQLLLRRRDFETAWSSYSTAADLYRLLGEPEGEAIARHQLGRIAQAVGAPRQAEECFRTSLAIWEQRRRPVEAASCCNQLAILAEEAGRGPEADAWYRLAIDFAGQAGSAPMLASYLENYAGFLHDRVAASPDPSGSKSQAEDVAAQAAAIRQSIQTTIDSYETGR